MPWCRLRSLVEHLPLDSAYRRATDPDRHGDWGIPEQLLAKAVHLLEVHAWQWSGDESTPQPEPLLMPWEQDEREAADVALVAQLRANAAMN